MIHCITFDVGTLNCSLFPCASYFYGRSAWDTINARVKSSAEAVDALNEQDFEDYSGIHKVLDLIVLRQAVCGKEFVVLRRVYKASFRK